jgi:hypothetical protein
MTSPRLNPMTAATEGSVTTGILAPLSNPGFRLPPLQMRPPEPASQKFRRPWPVQSGLDAGR